MTDPPSEVPEPEKSGRSVFAKRLVVLGVGAIPLLAASAAMTLAIESASCETPASGGTATFTTVLFLATVVWVLAVLAWSIWYLVGGTGSAVSRIFKTVALMCAAGLVTIVVLASIFSVTFFICW
jgi:hypothetical protein